MLEILEIGYSGSGYICMCTYVSGQRYVKFVLPIATHNVLVGVFHKIEIA